MPRQQLLVMILSTCLCASSCGLKLQQYQTIDSELAVELAPLFNPEVKELVFDLSIEYGKDNQNSGILAVVFDSLDKTKYRTVFMAKTGLKLFDFSFTSEDMIINHIIPQMNKRIVKSILRKDLRLLLDNHIPPKTQPKRLLSTYPDTKVYHFKKQRKHYRFTLDKSEQLIQVDKGKKKRSFVSMSIKYDNPQSPSEIFIEHHRLPFAMRLISLSSN